MELKVLREHKLYGKLSKCDFNQRKIQYLGHVISQEGISMDPEHTEATVNWLTPKNVTYLRSFIGIASCYRRFIEGFSKIAHPVTSLKKKDANFVWSKKCEDNFTLINKMLTSALVLKIRDLEKYFIVCTDSCNTLLGGFLMQEGHVIFYVSRNFK